MAESSKMGRLRDSSAVLPEELVVWEILVRLPAKALVCCRAVCRSWRRLTSTDNFLIAHHRHQPSLPLVCFRKMGSGRTLEVFDLRKRPTKRQPVLRLSKICWFEVHGSCDGLILFTSNRSVNLCNPSTRQWIKLPSLNGAHVMGMYSHGPSGEYSVLYTTREINRSGTFLQWDLLLSQDALSSHLPPHPSNSLLKAGYPAASIRPSFCTAASTGSASGTIK